MVDERSFLTTFSHFSQTSGLALASESSDGSMINPAVFNRALWHVTQYWVKTTVGAAGAWGAGAWACEALACSARRAAAAIVTTTRAARNCRICKVRMLVKNQGHDTESRRCIGIYLSAGERVGLGREAMKNPATLKSPGKLTAIAVWLLAGASTAGAASSDLRLIDAVKRADLQTVRSLVAQRVDINASEPDGSTALHWATRRDNPVMVDLLVSAGANARAATRYNVTPLALACANGNAVVIERLVKAGADPNGTSEEGQTALMTASLTGKVAAVKALVAHGANVNAKEPYKGQTALM